MIGDSKGPFEYDLPGTELWTLDRQRSLTFGLQARLPVKHYSRKNLGYLIAIERGAGLIYETDDDNAPLNSWKLRTLMAKAITLEAQHWSNVYRWFSDDLIGPSATPGEGKATIAAHLAIANADRGKKTLLVDGDLRRPSMHSKFGFAPHEGLSNVLTGELAWRDVVLPITGTPSLSLLPAGLGSHRAADLTWPKTCHAAGRIRQGI